MSYLRSLFRLLLVPVMILGGTMGAIALGRQTGLFEPLELLWYDRLLQLDSLNQRSAPQPSRHVTIVAITGEDLKRYGWPLRDQVLADTIEVLQQGSARVIGIDLYRDLAHPPGEEALQMALKQPNVIGIEEQISGIPPHPALAGEQVGFNDLVLDNDGVLRRSLLFVGTLEEPFYSFALRVALVYLAAAQPKSVPLALEPGQEITIAGHPFPILQAYSGGYDRLDYAGYQVLLHYNSATLPTVSLSQLLAGEVDPSLIQDRAVILGSVDPTLKDLFRTPYSSGLRQQFLLTGVEVHGQMIQQILGVILDGNRAVQFLSIPGESVWILFWMSSGVGLGYLLRRPLWSTLAVAGLGAMLLGSSILLFQGVRIWLPLVSPGLGLGAGWVFILAYRAYQFQQHQQIVMRLLGQSLSPEVAQSLWNQRDTLLKSGKLSGQTLMATVLFADLCQFSTIAETMDPEALMDWLNECLDPVTQLVRSHNGIVNKFTGDGFMAVFGLPMARHSQEITADAQSAVLCAVEIAQLLNALNQQWLSTGKPVAKMRIGIFTGKVIAGSLGGRDRMEYGILGDTVNTASRLESWEKERMDYPCRILVGQSTYEHLCHSPNLLANISIQSWGLQHLKGKAQPVAVYEIIPKVWTNAALDSLTVGGKCPKDVTNDHTNQHRPHLP